MSAPTPAPAAGGLGAAPDPFAAPPAQQGFGAPAAQPMQPMMAFGAAPPMGGSPQMQMSKSFGGGPTPMQVCCRVRVTTLPTLAGYRANSPSVAGAEHWSTSARMEEPFVPLHIIHSPSISSAVDPTFDILTFTSYQPLAAHVVILPAGQSHVCFGAAAGQACRRRRLAGRS